MFKIVGDDLPEVATLGLNLAPTIRVFDGEEPYELPPIAKISAFGGRNAPSNSEEIPLSNPDYAGYLFVVTPGFEFSELTSLSSSTWTFSGAANPLAANLGSYWIYNNKIYILAELKQLGIADGLTVSAIASANIGVPDTNQNFLIDLTEWGDVTVNQVLVNEILFTPAANPSSPQTKEFKVAGSTLTLYADTATTPNNFAIAQVFVEKEIGAPVAPSARVAVFDFSAEEVFYLDAISYLGTAFAPPQNAWNPLYGEFFWREPQATLFMNPLTPLSPKRSITDVAPAKSDIGSITYPSRGV